MVASDEPVDVDDECGSAMTRCEADVRIKSAYMPDLARGRRQADPREGVNTCPRPRKFPVAFLEIYVWPKLRFPFISTRSPAVKAGPLSRSGGAPILRYMYRQTERNKKK